jgi:hypothetical protein
LIFPDRGSRELEIFLALSYDLAMSDRAR